MSWLPNMLPPMAWNQFFPSFAGPDDEQKNRYAELMDKMSELNLDSSSASIFTVVNLFSTDPQLALEQEAAIVSTQKKYKALLYRYLRDTRGSSEKATAAYRDFMLVAANLKEMSEIISNRTINMASIVV